MLTLPLPPLKLRGATLAVPGARASALSKVRPRWGVWRSSSWFTSTPVVALAVSRLGAFSTMTLTSEGVWEVRRLASTVTVLPTLRRRPVRTSCGSSAPP